MGILAHYWQKCRPKEPLCKTTWSFLEKTNGATIGPWPFWENIKRNKVTTLKGYYHIHVHRSTSQNSQCTEAAQAWQQVWVNWHMNTEADYLAIYGTSKEPLDKGNKIYTEKNNIAGSHLHNCKIREGWRWRTKKKSIIHYSQGLGVMARCSAKATNVLAKGVQSQGDYFRAY